MLAGVFCYRQTEPGELCPCFQVVGVLLPQHTAMMLCHFFISTSEETEYLQFDKIIPKAYGANQRECSVCSGKLLFPAANAAWAPRILDERQESQ